MEEALHAKKAFRKQQEKHAQFYDKLKVSEIPAAETFSAKKKSVLVESLLQKFPEARTPKGTKAKKVASSKCGIKRKSLTIATPFEFQTDKRIKRDEDAEGEYHEPYEPLWAIVKKSFTLREDVEMSNTPKLPRQLTQPKSPAFELKKRFTFKENLDTQNIEEPEQTTFKARPINPALFKKQASLPQVARRSATEFEEFNLSRPKSRDVS